VARGIDEVGVKKVLDEIKEKQASWTDLKEKTKLSDKSLTRYLKCLEFWDLARKNDAGNWDWFERARTYRTEHDYQTALNHSKKMLNTLAGFSSVALLKPELFQERENLPPKTQDSLFLYDRVREHLNSGYPSLYSEVADFEKLTELRNEIKKELKLKEAKIDSDRLFEYVGDFHRLKRYAIPKKHWKDVEKVINKIGSERQALVERTEENYTKSYLRISKAMLELSYKIEHGEPLLGLCKLCPKSRVASCGK
jgi:hypothetical protein